MGLTSSKQKHGDRAAEGNLTCGMEWLCSPERAGGGSSDDDEFSSLEVHAKVKRRGQNVFDESVEIESLPQQKVTPQMKKSKATKAVIRAALNKNFVFNTFDQEEMENFVEYMERYTVRAGQQLIAQGEQGDFFYVVEHGEFRFIVDGKPVGNCHDGASFGELALLYGSPRAATVVAKTPATVWRLQRRVFRATVAHATARSKGTNMQALAKVELLQGLSEDQLHKVSDAVQVVKKGAGAPIVKKGEVGNVFYMIAAGTCVVTDIKDSKGAAMPKQLLEPGACFGEMALLTGEPRAATVVAKTNCALLALSRTDFEQLLGPLRVALDETFCYRTLANIGILAKLSNAERMKAVRLLTTEKFAPGAKIIKQDDKGDKFYIIKSGQAEVLVAKSKGGEAEHVNTLQSGDYFGEMALVRDEKRSASIIAHGDHEVVCFTMRRADFTATLGGLAEIMDRAADARRAELKRVTDGNLPDGIKLSPSGVPLPPRMDLKFSDLKRLAILGAGTFGRVSLVQLAGASGEVYALKALHKNEIVAHKQEKNVMNERNMMLLSAHPFILTLLATFKDRYKLYMLLEFIQGGELFNVVHTRTRDGVPLAHARFYAAVVSCAFGYLGSKDIAYRDLKPENLMVATNGYLKVVDFGFAKIVKGKTYTLCGTPEYLAPEIVLGRGHNNAVDWWAVGVLLYEMIAGYSPYADPQGMDQTVICRNIVAGKTLFPRGFDPHAKDLVKKLLVKEPTKRFGCGRLADTEVREHPFFGPSFDWNALLALKVDAPWKPTVKSKTDVSQFEPFDVDETIDTSYQDKTEWDMDF